MAISKFPLLLTILSSIKSERLLTEEYLKHLDDTYGLKDVDLEPDVVEFVEERLQEEKEKNEAFLRRTDELLKLVAANPDAYDIEKLTEF